MRRPPRKLGNLIRRWASPRRAAASTRQPSYRRLELEALEDRSLLSLSTVSGVAYIDLNGNGVRDANEAILPGVQVTLTGTPATGNAVNVSAITDANGSFSFQRVQPGTYQLQVGTVAALLGGGVGSGGGSTFTLSDGENVSQDFSFQALAPQLISMREFLSSTQQTDFPYAPAGDGQAVLNSPPFVLNPIADITGVNSGSTTIDLAGVFSDPDLSDSIIRFDTSAGPIKVELFDATAPRTVANFFNYIQEGKYDGSIFHRLVAGFVLQGGGFTFSASPAGLNPVTVDPAVQNEFGVSNTFGTLAMAKQPNDPNSATSQFFFNLGDNSSNLDNQNGGFTVFGKIVDSSDQQVLNTLAATPVRDESNGDPNSNFATIPLNNYTGTNFPSDTTAANYLLVQDVAIVKRPEALTYEVVSNTNPQLVVATITNNRLNLQNDVNLTGSATITIRATDQFGASVDTSFKVTVGASG
jgi:cyclophilin family peptidyl-prolyl cis-trans isomerase